MRSQAQIMKSLPPLSQGGRGRARLFVGSLLNVNEQEKRSATQYFAVVSLLLCLDGQAIILILPLRHHPFDFVFFQNEMGGGA